MSWIPPSSYRNFSVLCISRCHSGVAVAGAQKHLERKPPPGSQKGSFQDITPQRVTFATLGIAVCFWSSVSICDSFSLCSPPSRLPGHEHGATRVFSAEHLATFVLDTEKTKYRHSPPAHHIPCPVSSAFTVGALLFFYFSARRAEMLLQESQRALASSSGAWQLEGKEDVWKARKGITWEINVTSWLIANLLENCFLRGLKENLVKVGQLVQPFPVLYELKEMMVWTQQSI